MKVKFRKVIKKNEGVIHTEDARISAFYKEGEMLVTPTVGMIIKFGGETLRVSHITYDVDRQLLLVTESRVCSDSTLFDPIVEDWKKLGWIEEAALKGKDAYFSSRFENLCVHDDIKWDQLKRH